MIDPDAIAAAVATAKQGNKEQTSNAALAAGKGASEGAVHSENKDTAKNSPKKMDSEKDSGKNPKMDSELGTRRNHPQNGIGNVEQSVPHKNSEPPMRSATNPTPEKQSGGRDAGAGPGDLGSLATPTFGASSPNSGSNRGR